MNFIMAKVVSSAYQPDLAVFFLGSWAGIVLGTKAQGMIQAHVPRENTTRNRGRYERIYEPDQIIYPLYR